MDENFCMNNDALIAQAEKLVGEFSLSEPWLTAGSVASALVTQAGNLYTGICLDLACGIGFCAEHTAVASMLQDRETVVAKIVAVGVDRVLPPCGHCRELLAQVDRRNLDCEVVLGPSRSLPLKKLLPDSWLEQDAAPA